MSDATLKCSFCDGVASFGPYGTTCACEPCARRVARLAAWSNGEGRSAVWETFHAPAAEAKPLERAHFASVDPEKVFEEFKRGVERQLSPVNGETHLHLAIAYREMALHGDAVREAAVAFEGTRERTIAAEALGVLLSAPLLRPDGIDGLRARFRTN